MAFAASSTASGGTIALLLSLNCFLLLCILFHSPNQWSRRVESEPLNKSNIDCGNPLTIGCLLFPVLPRRLCSKNVRRTAEQKQYQRSAQPKSVEVAGIEDTADVGEAT